MVDATQPCSLLETNARHWVASEGGKEKEQRCRGGESESKITCIFFLSKTNFSLMHLGNPSIVRLIALAIALKA